MPGRAYIGLSSDEKHPGQFRPGGLPDRPSISLGRVIAGVVEGLLILGLGYSIHTPDGLSVDCTNADRWTCPPQWGGNVPMIVWLSVAALVATVVIGWPYLSFAFKRWARNRS